MRDKIFVSYGPASFKIARRLHRDLRILGYRTYLDSPRITDSLGSIVNLLKTGTRIFMIHVHIGDPRVEFALENRLNSLWSYISLNPNSPVFFVSANFTPSPSKLVERFIQIDFSPDYERGLVNLSGFLDSKSVKTTSPSNQERLNIGILKNGIAPYAENISEAFIETCIVKLSPSNKRPVFSEHIGFAETYNKQKNNKIIANLLRSFNPEKPDFVLSIGTQVSLSLKDFDLVEENMPRQIFAGVGDPKRCGLVSTRGRSRSEKISGVQYGPAVVRRLEFLRTLMPSATWAFVYNRTYIQDLLFAQQINSVISRKKEWRSSFTVLDAVSPQINDEMAKQADAFFGFYYLNREMESFLQSTDKPIVGIDEDDVSIGAVASTGSDDFLIGQAAATQILMPCLFDDTPLEDIPVIRAESPRYIINISNCRDRKLRVDIEILKKQFSELRVLVS